MEGNSELAQLLAQIEAENIAAHRALADLSSGTARHQFITAKMERMGQLSDRLIQHIGAKNALPLIVSLLDNPPLQPETEKGKCHASSTLL
jgi:hypothetical protein